jgi:hypothetical protein
MEVVAFSRIGAWKTYEELEESLTVNELMETVKALRVDDKEQLRRMIMAQHGEDPFPEGDSVEVGLTVADVARRATGQDWGDDTVNDMNAVISDDFGANAFGYEVE